MSIYRTIGPLVFFVVVVVVAEKQLYFSGLFSIYLIGQPSVIKKNL